MIVHIICPDDSEAKDIEVYVQGEETNPLPRSYL